MFKDLPAGERCMVDPTDVELFPYHPDTPLFRQKYAEYLTRQTIVDREMGRFIQELEKDGLLDDTFIFHYGDHGGVLPGSKGYAYNDGLQVAMVVYVPKNWQHLVPTERGTRIDGFVEFTDLSATVLNLAGVEIPKEIDGRPFLGKGVELDELNRRDTTFGYADRFDEKYDMVRFLRKGNFAYIRSYQPYNFDGLHNDYRYKQPAFVEWRKLALAGKLNKVQQRFYEARPPEMLFDLSKDPHQINNLASDPAYADQLVAMRRALRDREKAMPDVGFFPESRFLKQSRLDGKTFGQKNKEEISRLIDIADLQLRPFPEAKAQIQRALSSDKPMERYWGLITCSAFGEKASCFYKIAEQLATEDSDRLVRVRAAEFLGLTGAADPMPYIYSALEQCHDRNEVNLILNSIVLLHDGAGVKIDPTSIQSAHGAKMPGLVAQRVRYLCAEDDKKK